MDLTHAMSPAPRQRTRLGRRGAAAVMLVGGLALAGCGVGVDGQAGPADAMEARLAGGMDVAVTVEADAAGLDEADARALAAMTDQPLFELSVDADGEPTGFVALGALEARVVDGQDVYMRLDRDRVSHLSEATGPEAGDPLAELDALAAQAEAVLGDQADVAVAFAAGDWVGMQDVPNTLQELAGGQGLGGMLGEMAPDLGDMAPDAGTPLPFPMMQSGIDEETQALLAEQGLGSIADFLDEHATVTGDGPWEVTIDVESVRDALATVADEGGTIDESMLDDLDDAPAEVGGITIEAVDGVASAVRINLVEMAQGLDEDDAEMAELRDAAPVVVMTMSDHTPSEAPVGAVMTSLDELFSAVIGR